MSNLSIAITGHRPKDIDNDYALSSEAWLWIGQELRWIFEKDQPPIVISGMALGVDTLSAEIALKLNIPLVAAIPFEGQEKNWPKKSQERYHAILEQAAEVVVVNQVDYYANWLFQKRNEYMVDRAELIVAVWNGRKKGGTFNCLKYALGTGKPVWCIDPQQRLAGRYNGFELIPRENVVDEEISTGQLDGGRDSEVLQSKRNDNNTLPA